MQRAPPTTAVGATGANASGGVRLGFRLPALARSAHRGSTRLWADRLDKRGKHRAKPSWSSKVAEQNRTRSSKGGLLHIMLARFTLAELGVGQADDLRP